MSKNIDLSGKKVKAKSIKDKKIVLEYNNIEYKFKIVTITEIGVGVIDSSSLSINNIPYTELYLCQHYTHENLYSIPCGIYFIIVDKDYEEV